MSAEEKKPSPFVPPVSTFAGPVAELIALRMLSPPPRPGLLAMLDDYEIVRLLGTGGMGLVLLAQPAGTGREVAIKMIRSEFVTNQEVVHRFLREAGHLKRMRHSNIVPVEAISERAAGPYFVMPYFDKGSLASLIKPGIPLAPGSILDIGAQVAGGLSFAHRSGIIHRDLKPANVLLAASGRACLADFGLARTLFNDTMVDVENRNHEGTAPYMSPAVAAGDAEDTRCDIYSFGALLYEMLTGTPPYQGRGTREILDQIIAGPPKPVTDLNPDADPHLVKVARDCMARELRDRYADMRDVVKDLEQIQLHKPPAGHRRFARSTVFRPTQAKLAIGLIILVALILAWNFGFDHGRKKGLALAPLAPVAATNPVTASNPARPAAPPPPVPVRPLVWTVSTLAGQAGVRGSTNGSGVSARFHLPNSLAVDSLGNLYVADTANQSIRRIYPAGVVSTVAGMPHLHGTKDGAGSAARFWGPFGLAVDGTNNCLYVADTGNDTIRKISPDGTVRTLAGGAGRPGSADGPWSSARFRNPWGLAVEPDGDVVVADSSNDTIRKIVPDGLVYTIAGQAGMIGSLDGFGDNAEFNNPSAVAEDAAGNIYVADSGNDVIRKITPSRVVSTLAGSAGMVGSADGNGVSARFWNPLGLAVDGSGNIYVADTGNNVIRKITPMGQVTTIAGLAGNSGSADGTGADARFNGLAGIAVDQAGNIYVADTNNHTIRKCVAAPASGP